jgi:hypothetical protein
MSTARAIEAVTLTLRKLIEDAVAAAIPGTSVTTRPPDRARENVAGHSVNLFLYETALNAAFRNMEVPLQNKPGETGRPPLPLNLFYLLTAYSNNDNDAISHHLLGSAMGVLHDHPLLNAAEIQAALAESQLQHQLERVRITHQPMQVEEMSKLWMMFQTQYRISAAYQVAVVLIESTRGGSAPLPVLSRSGADDPGAITQADLIPPFPAIETVVFPSERTSALLGDVLAITGHHLDGDSRVVEFSNRRLNKPISVDAQAGGSGTEFQVKVEKVPATDPAAWPAGFYTITAIIKRALEPDRTTNELAITLAPVITGALPLDVTRAADHSATIPITCSPEVRPGQRVSLIVGGTEVMATPFLAQTASVSFKMNNAPVGEFFIRLRVDGVDSILIKKQNGKPVFDQTQKVAIHD